MELDYKAIGKRLKIARIQADLTQERLSAMADVSPSHMSNIETGTTRVSLTTLVRLANALSVTADDLLCDSLIHARYQFEGDIQRMLDDCDQYELRVVKELIQSAVTAMRANERLKRENELP